MRRALDYARGLGVTLAQHCEDARLAGGAAMHEGAWSSRLRCPRGAGRRPRSAMVARDIAFSCVADRRPHAGLLAPVVCGEAPVELVRRAKAEGLPVTAEAAPASAWSSPSRSARRLHDPVFC